MSLDHTIPNERRLTGRHVLAVFVGFFLVVFAMNAVMIYQAVTTFGGLETTDAYRKGLAYNERIAAEERQAALGWKAEIAATAASDAVTAKIVGTDGAPITGLTVTGTIGRTATNRFDRTLDLRETEPGVYTGAVDERLAPGGWVANLAATRGAGDGQQRFDMRRRVWVNP